MHNPAVIGNYFLDKATRDGRALTPMQLIKLVYIAHGWHLGYTGQPLINESVEAWKFGPVIPSLYQAMKRYGSGAVREPLPTGPMPWMRDADVDEQARPLLDSVWNSYAGFSGVQLSNLTHQPNTPWHVTWHQHGAQNYSNASISNELIREHYEARVRGVAEVRQAASA